MASLCRPAPMAGLRSIALRSRRITYRDLNRSSASSPFSSSTRASPCASRIAVSRLGSLESLFPLHSTVAAARLKSRIAVDSSCWSWLSQGDSMAWYFESSIFHVDAIDKGDQSIQLYQKYATA